MINKKQKIIKKIDDFTRGLKVGQNQSEIDKKQYESIIESQRDEIELLTNIICKLENKS